MAADTVVVPVLDGATAGLSPPDSNPALKDNASDSDLSELEPDLVEDVMPAEQPVLQPADSTATETKDPDLLDITPYEIQNGVPVFKPTMEEFSDFTRFMDSINHYGMKSGIAKVIPPKEWLDAQPSLDEAVKSIVVKNPLSQDFQKGATPGEFRQINMDHNHNYNLPQWRNICNQRPAPMPRGQRKAEDPNRKERTRAGKKANSSALIDRPLTPMSPPAESTEIDAVEEEPFRRPAGRMGGGRQPKSESEAVSVSARRKHGQRATGKIDEAAFVNFDYRFDYSEFTDARCEELEAQYWRSLMNAPPLYGADMLGSLFDDRTKVWNLGKLPNILDVLNETIPGVNTAYLYVGSWKATFAWHLEDVDLYSINYLHFGAPKQWYSIAQDDVPKFEAAMRKAFPESAKSCDQFLRHKTFLISPSRLLAASGVKVNKIVHRPGEFVITFPYGYHSGYNLGYNCAEAVNFALESWLDKGMEAKKCECAEKQDPVWIDVRSIKKALGHEVPPSEDEFTEYEEYDESEDVPTDLPTPPNTTGDVKVKQAKKRKRPTSEKTDGERRVRIKLSTKAHPCILCPSDHWSEALLPTDRGEKVHHLCAKYVPGPVIDPENKLVTRIPNFEKARLALKCFYCKVKFGVCFQCSATKCARAYHATCAAAAGVLVEEGWSPVYAEDGTEYKEWKTELSCRFHRPKRDKNYIEQAFGEWTRGDKAHDPETGAEHTQFDAQAHTEFRRILKAAENLKKGEVCQVQDRSNVIWAGAVVENRIDEEMVLLSVVPNGDIIQEVPYKWLLLSDPAKVRFQQASEDAKELPKSLGDSSSDSSNRQADDLPKPDDLFVAGFTWAEFKRQTILRNRDQVKIDLSKSDRIWYYLGKTSTEAKAQFTEDPAKPRHNKAGHFLDTVEKPIAATSRPSLSASFPSSALRHGIPTVTPSRLNQVSLAVTFKEKEYEYKPRPDKANYNLSIQNPLRRPNVPLLYGSDPRFQPAANQNNSVWQSPQPNARPASQNPFTVYNPLLATNLLQKKDDGWVAPSARPLSQSMTRRMPDAQALDQLLSNKDLEYHLGANRPPIDIEAQFGLSGPSSQGSGRKKSLNGASTSIRPGSAGSSGSKVKKPKHDPLMKQVKVPTGLPVPTPDQAKASNSSPSEKYPCRQTDCRADGVNTFCSKDRRFCAKGHRCESLTNWTRNGGGRSTCDCCLETEEALRAGKAAQKEADAAKTAAASGSKNFQPHLDQAPVGSNQPHQSNGYSQQVIGYSQSQPGQGFPEQGGMYSQRDHNLSSSFSQLDPPTYSQPDFGQSRPHAEYSQLAPTYHNHSIPRSSQNSSSIAPPAPESKPNGGKYQANNNFGSSIKSAHLGTKYPYPTPSKPTNLGFTQSWKYKYLQLEHNKGSSDYKSPYRPGPEFGFMNGYQGSVLSGAILKELSKFLSLPQMEEAKRMSQSKAQELLTSFPQSQQLSQPPNAVVHPAIRQQYSDLVQPRSWSNPRKSNGSILEAPSLSGGIYKSPQPDPRVQAPQVTRPVVSPSPSQLYSSTDTTKSSQQSTFQTNQFPSTPVSNNIAKHSESILSSAMPSPSEQSILDPGLAPNSTPIPNAHHENVSQTQKASPLQSPDNPNSHTFQESPVSNMQPCTSSLIEGILGKLKKVQ